MEEGGDEEIGVLPHDQQIKKLNKVFKRPRLLADPDLDREGFAAQCEQRFGRLWRRALDAVVAEMIFVDVDGRTLWRDPTAEEEFALLTGESADYIRIGKIVQCTVRKIIGGNAAANAFAAFCKPGAPPSNSAPCTLWLRVV